MEEILVERVRRLRIYTPVLMGAVGPDPARGIENLSRSADKGGFLVGGSLW